MKKEEQCKCGSECNCHEHICDDTCTCGCQEGESCTCHESCDCGCEEGNCGCSEEQDDCKLSKKDKKKKSKDELNQLRTQNEQLQQEILVAKADLINYRKRKDEEVIRMLRYCNEDIIKHLLPIMDNFERAMKVGSTDEKMLEGIKMIYCNLENVLSGFEVKPIDGFNKPFDPVYHNALLTEHKDDVEPGMVLEVLQRGYLYKDKVIRPAMVKVSE